jgi:hypothetical protein
MRHFVGLIALTIGILSLAPAADASCLIQDRLETYDVRLSTKEAWVHCSLQDARLFDSFYETSLRGYETLDRLTSVPAEHRVLFEQRKKQSVINREVMRKTLLPVSEGGEGRTALLNIQSDYQDQITGEAFSLSGFGTLIAKVSRLPDNRMTPLNSKTNYYVLTAAHLVQGSNLRVIDSLGTELAVGKTFIDDQADAAVIELSADPLIQPLAYMNPDGRTQQLATYLEDINYSSQQTKDRFSGYSYDVTPMASADNFKAYQYPGFFLGHFEESAQHTNQLLAFPQYVRQKNGATLIDRSVRAGLSGTPIIADIGARYLSIVGLVTYSGAQADSFSHAAGERSLLKLLQKAMQGSERPAKGRWLFFDGVPVHQLENETQIFFAEKPIGNGIYVNGRRVEDAKVKMDPKLKTRMESELPVLSETFKKRRDLLRKQPSKEAEVADQVFLELQAKGINAHKQ